MGVLGSPTSCPADQALQSSLDAYKDVCLAQEPLLLYECAYEADAVRFVRSVKDHTRVLATTRRRLHRQLEGAALLQARSLCIRHFSCGFFSLSCFNHSVCCVQAPSFRDRVRLGPGFLVSSGCGHR